jgi:hypothetical protein
MANSTAFLFLDECMYEPLDLVALTGVLVPLGCYCQLRDEICAITWKLLNPPPNTVPAPIELHASNLLAELGGSHDQDVLDRLRVDVFESAVNLVNRYRLRVFRVAYLNHSEIRTSMEGDPQLYGLTFFGIKNLIQDCLANTLIIPVMDGIPSSASEKSSPPRIDRQLIRSFALGVRNTHHFRQNPAVAKLISIKNTENLAEPLFADSQFSTMLQLTDLVSYLLLQLERDEREAGRTISDYRAEVLRCAKAIDHGLLKCWIDRMEFA